MKKQFLLSLIIIVLLNFKMSSQIVDEYFSCGITFSSVTSNTELETYTFSWLTIHDSNFPPPELLLIEIDYQPYHNLICGQSNQSFNQVLEVNLSVNPTNISYSLHQINRKCFRWRLKLNCSNWTNWKEYEYGQ